MTSSSENPPPVAKYKLTMEITGNSHEEIESALSGQANGGYLLRTKLHERDEFDATDGRCSATLEHTNPSMTPEQYEADLHAWAEQRRAARKAVSDDQS